ncbi:glycosyltransferase family 2 protein [Erythrobacter sp. T5W1-R]|uniref:glycosyltransferase family 2 protein n=1 Tax=Erythrobacter sp. T5W1-R TaxID=3101752 RepID=UPI002B003AB7|nr:glycosyltransferase family 2 protein [Erythrobacter sp. T5W1-R]MEA1620049.1 glycosyltransferase family 2 protein [Erythrobacter sp. T5W1-R]
MAEPRILVVLLNYRTADMTLRAAEAALCGMEDLDAEMVIVDNNSGDGSFEMLCEAALQRGWADQSKVRVVASGRNGGYGAGNNFGIRQNMSNKSKPDYIYCLNSDAFPDRGAIRALLEVLESDHQIGLAGSYIKGPDGDPHQTAFRFPSIASEFEGAAHTGPISRLLRNSIVPLPLPERTVRVDWLAGASVMIRRSVLDEIGCFDETFFLYYEETDLCRRASLAGYGTMYVRESEVTHIGSVSTGMKQWGRTPSYWFDSRRYYFVKNHGRAYATVATLAHIAGALIWRLRCLISGRKSHVPERFLRDLIQHSLSRPRPNQPLPQSMLPQTSIVD